MDSNTRCKFPRMVWSIFLDKYCSDVNASRVFLIQRHSRTLIMRHHVGNGEKWLMKIWSSILFFYFYFVAKLWVWCIVLNPMFIDLTLASSHLCTKTAQSLSRMKLNQHLSLKQETEFVASVLVVLVLSGTAWSGPVCLCSLSDQHRSYLSLFSTLLFLQMTATPWPVRPAVWSSLTTSSGSPSVRRLPIRRDSCILPSEWPTCCSISHRWNVPKATASKRNMRWGAAIAEPNHPAHIGFYFSSSHTKKLVCNNKFWFSLCH